MKKADIFTGWLLLLLGGSIIFHTASFPPGRPEIPGPAFFPRFVAMALSILGLALIYKSRRSKSAPPITVLKGDDFFRVGIVLVLSILYVFLLTIFGFLITTMFYLIALMFLFRAGGLIRIVLISVATVIFIYLTFQVFLQVPLPTGSFFD